MDIDPIFSGSHTKNWSRSINRVQGETNRVVQNIVRSARRLKGCLVARVIEFVALF